MMGATNGATTGLAIEAGTGAGADEREVGWGDARVGVRLPALRDRR